MGDEESDADVDKNMMAVITTGIGGYDKLDYRKVPIPRPGPGEVLLSVLAAGVNNTDINTRLGWYASFNKDGPGDTKSDADRPGGGWNGATPFPFIQGTDCCGRVVSVGPGGDESRIGSRVLVRSCMRKRGFDTMDTVWLGSDFDGAFAQYVKVPALEIFTVDCDWGTLSLARSLAPTALPRTWSTVPRSPKACAFLCQAHPAAWGRRWFNSLKDAAPK